MSDPEASEDLDGQVRRLDPERWLSSRFVADPQARADVVAIYAFDHELGDIALALGNLIRPDADGRPRLDINPQTERALRNDQRDRTFYAVLAPDHTLLAGDASLRGLAQPLPSSGQPAFGDGVLEGLNIETTLRLARAVGR